MHLKEYALKKHVRLLTRLYGILSLCAHLHAHLHCNFKYKIPLSDGWGLLD